MEIQNRTRLEVRPEKRDDLTKAKQKNWEAGMFRLWVLRPASVWTRTQGRYATEHEAFMAAIKWADDRGMTPPNASGWSYPRNGPERITIIRY